MRTAATRAFELLRQILGLLLKALLRHPKTTIFFSLFLIFSTVYFGKDVRIAVRIEDVNDPATPSHQAMEELKRNFGFEDKLTLVFKKPMPMTAAELCELKQWLTRIWNEETSIMGISGPFDLRDILVSGDKVFYPHMLGTVCAGELDVERVKTHPYLGFYLDENLKDAIVHFTIAPSEIPFRHGIYDYTIIERIVGKAKALNGLEVNVGGTLYFQRSVLEGIKWANKLNILAGVLLLLSFYFFYRSWRAGILLVTMVLTTNLILKGGMGLMDHPLDLLSSCLFLMMTVAVIEDFVFVCHIIRQEKKSFQEAVEKLLLPSFLTSLTTTIGFGSLCLSENPNIRNFGFWAGVGPLLEWAMLFLLMPVLMKQWPGFVKCFTFPPPKKHSMFDRLAEIKPARAMSIFVSLFPLALIYYVDKANLSYSPFDMFESDHEISMFREHFVRTRGAEGEVSFLFNRDNPRMGEVLKEVRKDKMVTHLYSTLDLEKSLSNYDKNLRPLLRQDFLRSSVGKFFASPTQERAIVFITSYDTKDIAAFQKRAQTICGKECEVVSEVIVSKDYAQGVLQTFYDSFTSAMFLLTLMMIWVCLYANPGALFPVVFSSLWSSCMLMIVVVVAQFKVNVVTAVAMAVLMGMSGDNAIQFLLLGSSNLSNSVANYGRASVQTLVMTAIIGSILLLSYFKSPKILAVLLLAGLVLMLIGDLWVLNGLYKPHSNKEE